ncbi:MAG: lysophospholipid acyltransferase family protein [Bacilli bacterium]|nr:lysophospholipid acyltransferase family protein [Bacilli bacterium]MDD4808518.1 lysophospholipid acyltransferase family protein [Bacilli bacterium]
MKLKTNSRRGEFGFKLMRFILKPIFLLYYHPKLINKGVIPSDGPVIIAGNHMHVLDQCLPIACTKRPIHYMAKKEYFDSKHAWFFKFVGCIPVNRQIKDTDATERAIDILNSGGALGIFPEGTRNKTEEFLLPFKLGTVSMAQKTGATIVPFGITGSYKRGKENNLTLRLGTPFKVEKDESLKEANEKLRTIIGDLMKENLK